MSATGPTRTTSGIPLSIIEWTIGRYAGAQGHHTAAGAFAEVWRWRGANYVGLLGVFDPWVMFLS